MNTTYEPAKAWRIAILLFLFMAVNFIDKIVVGLLAVPIMDELKLTPTQFGVIGGSFFWLFAVAGIAGGLLANRKSATVLLLLMGLAWSLCQIPIALSSSMAVLIAARVVLGMAEGPAFPIAAHAVFKWFPDSKRNVPVAVMTQGGAIGLLIAGICVPLITQHWGWRANFYVLFAIGMAWCLLWLLMGREGTVDQPAAGQGVAAPITVPYTRLLRDPTVISCLALHFVAFWALALTLTWLPAYLQKGLGFTAVQSGRYFAAIVTLSAILGVFNPWIAQRLQLRGMASRYSRGWFSSATLIISGLAFIALWLVPMEPFVRIVAIAVTLGMSPTIYALGPAMLSEVVPAAQRGGMLAIDNSLASVAGIAAPVVSAVFIQNHPGAVGYEMGFAFCGALMLVFAVLGALFINPAESARAIGIVGTGDQAEDAADGAPRRMSTTVRPRTPASSVRSR